MMLSVIIKATFSGVYLSTSKTTVYGLSFSFGGYGFDLFFRVLNKL